MNKAIIFLFFYISCFYGKKKCDAQQVSNSTLESWDTTGVQYFPIEWITAQNYFTFPCNPTVYTTERSSDSHSGNWAAKLVAKECTDDGGQQKVYIGFLASGVYGLFPHLAHGSSYNQRPGELNFYCKFLQIGSDTGYASIKLITLDSTGHQDQTIGSGSIDISNNVNVYSLFTIPITYYSQDQPDVIQIVFSTSKTLTTLNMLSASPPGNGAFTGTTLWVDDLTLSGGSLGYESIDLKQSLFFPNPMEDFSILTFNDPQYQECHFKLYNSQGMLLRSIYLLNQKQIRIDRDNLSSGIYYFQIYNNLKIINMGKLIMR